MVTGTVKTVTGKGYGFIQVDGSDNDVFFHENTLEGDLAARKLREGDKVTFEIEETPKGKNAVQIALVESEE